MKRVFLFFFCFVLLVKVYAQNTDTFVSGKYSEIKLSSILEDLNTRYKIRIFYKPDYFNNQKITVEFKDEKIKEVLAIILQSTEYSFIPYRNNVYVIVPEGMVGKQYDADYIISMEETLEYDPEDNKSRKGDVITFGSPELASPGKKVNISGKVMDKETGELLPGATLYFPDEKKGGTTDFDGKYSLSVEVGKYKAEVQYVGYKTIQSIFVVFSDDSYDFYIDRQLIGLDEVVIQGDAVDENVNNLQVGISRIDLEDSRKLPSITGEPDIVKIILQQPGVSNIGEGATGFNVRGGEVGQNLVLRDGALLFNSSHALGFMSTFNSELIKDASLYKGYFPSEFGGRLASVFDVKLKDGDYESWKVKGSINPFSTKAFFEGPLVKDKVSIMGSLRTTYSDWVLSLAKNPDVKQSTFNFMDVSFRYSHRLNEKSLLNINLYNSKDYFRYSKQFGFNYQTTLAQILYTYNINDNLFFDTSLSWSQYLSNQEELSFEKKFQFGTMVNYKSLKNKVTYYLPSGTEISGGTNTIQYMVNPGEIGPLQGSTTVSYDILNNESGIENALFLSAKWEMNSALGFEAGLRWNNYTLKGPFHTYSYLNDSYTLSNIQDTLYYEKGKKIKTYSHLEPRISFRLRLSSDLSMKGGYARAHQYINQISNVTTPTPTDVWKLSSNYIKPTSTHNYSLGLFKNFKDNKYEFSGEAYYRFIDCLYGLRDFAVIPMNDHLETELLNGVGRTYGLELSMKKKSGDIEGWISYTLSRSERKIEEINLGNWHLSDFDKPHDLSVVAKFNITNRKIFSLNFNYGVGRPATIPVGSYRIDHYLNVPIYSTRNQFRLPSNHRLDISYLIKKGYNKNKRVKKSWVFSVYNVYGRKNPFSIFFVQSPFDVPVANRLYMVGVPIPTVSLNFEFL